MSNKKVTTDLNIVNLLEKYCKIPALAGFEEPMIEALYLDLQPFCDSIDVDVLGNVIATIGGTEPGVSDLMIFAHIDSIGMIVKSIDENGYLRMERLGGVPEKVLPAKSVVIRAKNGRHVTGVIGTTSHHFTPPEDKFRVTPIAGLYIDIGAKNLEEVLELGINIGSPVLYEPSFRELLNGRVSGTSIDDRGGCAVLVEVAKRLKLKPPKANIFIVGSVQEEFNLRGAMVAAQKILPAAAISIDLSVSCDTPDLSGKSNLGIGLGPVFGTMTFHGRGTLNGLVPHPKMLELFENAANSLKIETQRHASLGMLTDASYVQLVGGGVACLDVGWATRYTHSGVEVCQISDLDELATLVTEVAQAFSPHSDFRRHPSLA
jgi:putative aminopeptidase FrvX